MEVLRAKAIKPGWGRQPWASESAFMPISNPCYRTAAGIKIELSAPIETVQKVLAKALKPGRRLLSVVRFIDGKMEEVRSVPEDRGVVAEAPVLPAPRAAPLVAATVAQPVRGCPAPAFDEADIRANRVLEAFLDADQLDDFRTQGSFVSYGQDTGHKYVITSREAPRQLRRFGGRSLYDVDEQVPYCVHDWTVPASEEMLALHLFLSVTAGETFLRHVPDLGQKD